MILGSRALELLQFRGAFDHEAAGVSEAGAGMEFYKLLDDKHLKYGDLKRIVPGETLSTYYTEYGDGAAINILRDGVGSDFLDFNQTFPSPPSGFDFTD